MYYARIIHAIRARAHRGAAARGALGLLAFFLVAGFSATPLRAQQNPPGRVARVSYLQGKVSLQVSGSDQWSEASRNYPLSRGDRLYTDQSSRAELQVGNAAVRMSEVTDLTMAELTDQLMQLGIGQGTVRVSVFALNQGESVEIDTPNGALTVLEPGTYRVDADPSGNGTLVTVNRGSLQVSGGGADQRLERGQAAKLTGAESVQVELASPPSSDDFDNWCAGRDRRIESAHSVQYVGRGVPGYEDLDEYGRWEEFPDYGPVWYPAAVPGGWVPYRYGRWVWVEPWGWTWVEDEPWGFCPFHYGRWVVAGGRWGWIPGPVVVRPVYAPALVVFVGGPNFAIGVGSFAAWFPLGPGEPFYPWYHHDDDYVRQVNITNIRNVTNVTNITNITNVTNINNIRYVNRGRATTAVPGDVFRSAQPVRGHVITVNPNQIARAQVIPHPLISPAPRAAAGGGAIVRPPAIPARSLPPRMGARPPVTPGTRSVTPTQRPPVTAPTRPVTPTGRAPQPTPTRPGTTADRPPETAPGGQPATRPRFVTRTPPPPQRLPFPTRQKAMQEHPGRPLEPQQRENLRQGKPAGPMRDQEVPSHPGRTAPSRPSGESKEKPPRGR